MRKERRGEREGESSAGQSGEDSVDEKIRRLTERIDELEGKDKRRGGDRVVKGYSSESDESGDKWRWDGRAWWHKVECKGPLNSRLRRRVSRAVSVALEQDSRKWREGFTKLQARIDWLQRNGQSKTWTSGASGSHGPGLFSSDDWDSQDLGRQFM